MDGANPLFDRAVHQELPRLVGSAISGCSCSFSPEKSEGKVGKPTAIQRQLEGGGGGGVASFLPHGVHSPASGLRSHSNNVKCSPSPMMWEL